MQENAVSPVNDLHEAKRVASRVRQNDETFRLLVESVRDYAIFLLDEKGNVASWNQGAERIKGYKADEIIGQHFSHFYPRDARESKWPERELEIASKEGRFEDEGYRVRKDGSTFWASVVITALRDNAGQLRGFSKVTRDLTERRELEERTRQLNRELRTRVAELIETQRLVELRTLELQRLSGELLRVQDEERRRIARDLHDELGQELAALKIEVDNHKCSGHEEAHAGLSRRASDLAESALAKVRNMSYLLHPPLLDESGLLPALHWYFEGLEKRGVIRVKFDCKPRSFPRLPQDIEVAIFRITQEALTNAYRHSGSEDARVELLYDGETATIRVRDFGKGMPDARLSIQPVPGVGISGMRERVKQLSGDFRILRVEPGTLVEATLPLAEG